MSWGRILPTRSLTVTGNDIVMADLEIRNRPPPQLPEAPEGRQ